MRVDVRVVEGPETGVSFLLEKNTRHTVGRGEEASVQLCEDELLSRIHFSLEFDGASLLLTDHGSTNGTFIDGKQVLPMVALTLNNGQSFIAGRVSRFTVNFVGAPEGNAPPNAPAPILPESHSDSGNFGSSFFSAPAPPAPTPPGSMSEGNFSQSIRTDFSGKDPILGNFGGSGPGSQLFGQNEQRSVKPQPTPPQTEPPSRETPSPPPSPTGFGDDYDSSIAAPGVQGMGDRDSFDYGGFDPASPPPPVNSPEKHRPPQLELPADPSAPAPTPIPPVNETSGSQPGSENVELSDAEMRTPPIYAQQSAPGQTPPPPSTTPTPAPPTPAPPTPAETPPPSPFESIGYAGQSVAHPGNQPAAPQPPSEANQSPFGASIASPQGGVSMPGQYHDAPKAQRAAQPTDVTPLTKKASFQLFQLENGLFVHAGGCPEDIPALVNALQQRLEAVYCAHLSRAELETATEEPPAAEESNDDSDSNFADDSPFGDSVGADLVPSADEPVTEEPVAEKRPNIGDPLFDWLPKEARWSGPVLLTADQLDFEIADIWGQDALVSFFGGAVDQMSDHLKKLVISNLQTGKKSKSMTGICWPSVLQAILATQPAKNVNRVFDLGGISAILLEDSTEEVAWQLVGKSDLSEHLYAAGFARI